MLVLVLVLVLVLGGPGQGRAASQQRAQDIYEARQHPLQQRRVAARKHTQNLHQHRAAWLAPAPAPGPSAHVRPLWFKPNQLAVAPLCEV